jgi:hypothetical protein
MNNKFDEPVNGMILSASRAVPTGMLTPMCHSVNLQYHNF